MTQPWWPGGGEPPAPATPANPAPWMPPPGHQQAGQRPASQQPHQANPWMPPPTPQSPTAALPAGQPITVVNTMEGSATGGPTTPGGQQPTPQRTVAGLGFVTFLLVVGAIAFAAFVARDWVVDWGTSVAACTDGGGAWECLSNHAGRTQVLLPLIAVLAAFSLARGAGVERRQGRGIGYLYAVLGFGVLALAWSMGAAA